jgi:hypothetical protein
MEIKDHKPHINVDYFEDLTGNISPSGNAGVDEIGQRIKN